MNTFKRTLFASTAAALLFATPVMAQDAKEQLSTFVENQLSTIGMAPVGLEYLSIDELGEIKTILESDATNYEQVEQIEQIIEARADTSGDVTVDFMESSLRDQIAGEMLDLGVEADVSTLSASQVAEIKVILETDAQNSVKADRIQEVLGS